jgi:hypothetical protein
VTEYGFCECGCGERTSIAKKTRGALGHKKGEPTRYIVGHQMRGKPAPNRRDDPPGLRRCSRCREIKDTAEFYAIKAGGFRSWCKACESEARRHGTPWSLRFLRNVGYETEDGCWPWTGARGVDGYGVMIIDKVPTRAHRVALRIVGTQIPVGHHTHHECENKRCVNPAHLRVLPAGEHHRLHNAR